MSGISNKRLKQVPINNIKNESTIKTTLFQIKESMSSISKSDKLFLLISSVIVFLSMLIVGFTLTGILQNIAILSVALIEIIAFLIYKICFKSSFKILVASILIFTMILCIISSIFSISASIGLKNKMSLASEIREIKKTSEKLISTDFADVYLNLDEKAVYTISNISGTKYINKNIWSVADNSEYYDMYNLAIEMEVDIQGVSDFFVYPPSPHTITGYEYLVEFDYQNETYVTKVFLPGLVNFNRPASALLFLLQYQNTADRYYLVSKIDDYLLFQSDVSSFSTPAYNVKYTSDDEYFYLRYNRYLDEVTKNEEDVKQMNENNVRFIKSLVPMSLNIKKVNFFWIGQTSEEGIFTATTPVMEVVYNNNTCDIAILKDISAKDLLSAIGYY